MLITLLICDWGSCGQKLLLLPSSLLHHGNFHKKEPPPKHRQEKWLRDGQILLCSHSQLTVDLPTTPFPSQGTKTSFTPQENQAEIQNKVNFHLP